MNRISLPEGYSYEKKEIDGIDYSIVCKRGIMILAIPQKHCPDEKIMEVARQTAD